MSNGTETRSDNGRDPREPVPDEPVAFVLAGAGARGAYEAGFVATLLPKLNPRPTIFVGTSAGAINAALLASVAHLSPEDAGNILMESWSKLRRERVFGPLLKSVPLALLKYAYAILAGGTPPDSLLDTKPLQAALVDPELLNWAQIRANIAGGKLEVLAFAATETGSGRTKIFYETKPESKSKSNGHSGAARPESDETQAIDYVRTQLNSDHVRASAAIPVLFPPVPIAVGERNRFFLDGGLRLNAPLKPAIQFGARGIVVVSTDPRHFGTSLAVEPKAPTMQGQVLQILRALFADRMIEDIGVLLRRNRRHDQAKPPCKDDSDDRVIQVIFGGPQDQDRVGGVAARVLKEMARGLPVLRFFKNLDFSLLDLITSVSATSGPDLISYIFFDPRFISGALKAGIQDASALLNDYPEPKDLWNALQTREQRRARKTRPAAPAPTATEVNA